MTVASNFGGFADLEEPKDELKEEDLDQPVKSASEEEGEKEVQHNSSTPEPP